MELIRVRYYSNSGKTMTTELVLFYTVLGEEFQKVISNKETSCSVADSVIRDSHGRRIIYKEDANDLLSLFKHEILKVISEKVKEIENLYPEKSQKYQEQLKRVLQFYSEIEVHSFSEFLGNKKDAVKLLLSSIDNVGAFYAISNPCKLEDSINTGSRMSVFNSYTAKGIVKDKEHGFFQYDGIKRNGKPVRAYCHVSTSNDYYWAKGERPKVLRLGLNNEGIFVKEISF